MKRRDAIKSLSAIAGFTAIGGASILTSCKESGPMLTWNPTVFTNSQGYIIEVLAEILLPKTNTPGAKEVGVHLFIDDIIGNIVSEDEKEKFLEGLDKFASNYKDQHNLIFYKSSTPAQKAHLDTYFADGLDNFNKKSVMDTGEAKIEMEESGEEKQSIKSDFYFVKRLKELAYEGFYTSPEIAKNQFVYDPIPGDYYCDSLEKLTQGKAYSL